MIVSSRALMPVIGAALMRNQHVGLTTTGSSMFPFIRSSDMLELEPLNRLPGVGDLVLARCPATPEGERNVLQGSGASSAWPGTAALLLICGSVKP